MTARSARKGGKGGKPPLPFAAWAAVGAGALLVALLWVIFPPGKREPKEAAPAAASSPVQAPKVAPAPSPRPPVPPSPSPKGILLIIDDLGHNRKAAAPFLAFGHPLTLAFLPDRPRTRELAEEAYARGKSVLLHLPMEPRDYPRVDPGAGALLVGMPGEDVRARLEEALASVPHARGASNHEGSRATEDEPLMETLLTVLAEREMVFVDSLTSNRSVSRALSARTGTRRLGRDVFLDNDRSPRAIRRQAEELFGLAESRGWAVGIAHPYPETADALPALEAEAKRRGLRWLTLDEAVDRAHAGD